MSITQARTAGEGRRGKLPGFPIQKNKRLHIDAKGTAVKIAQAVAPIAFYGPNGTAKIANGGLNANGGFSDISLTSEETAQPHLYTFTFDQRKSVTNFSLHMLDFGDWNYAKTTAHYVSMTAYNAGGGVVSKQELSYTTNGDASPRASNLYGDLYYTGDSVSAPLGQPGNWYLECFRQWHHESGPGVWHRLRPQHWF